MILYRSMVSDSSVTGLGVHTRWWMYGNITLLLLCYLARVRPAIKTAPIVRENNVVISTILRVYWKTWWRHQMETFSALLALCAGKSPVTGKFPPQMPVTRSFDVFFILRSNKWSSKLARGWLLQTPSGPLWRHCNEKWAKLVASVYLFTLTKHSKMVASYNVLNKIEIHRKRYLWSSTVHDIQSGSIVKQFSISWCYIQHCNDYGRSQIRIWMYKRNTTM